MNTKTNKAIPKPIRGLEPLTFITCANLERPRTNENVDPSQHDRLRDLESRLEKIEKGDVDVERKSTETSDALAILGHKSAAHSKAVAALELNASSHKRPVSKQDKVMGKIKRVVALKMDEDEGYDGDVSMQSSSKMNLDAAFHAPQDDVLGTYVEDVEATIATPENVALGPKVVDGDFESHEHVSLNDKVEDMDVNTSLEHPRSAGRPAKEQ
ncbi:hypothetical protein CspHIS471_0203600 [Cutaneotrichosporon sp. HIS471]|nr:hypothetical protein CspHIS471_0203600 [Cutaneotrichosporon sp. HIS471]